METADTALVLTLRPHADHGAVVRFLGTSHGLLAGYVHGARGKSKRAVLCPGNRVALVLSGRVDGQLANARVELLHSRALIAFEPAPAAALSWLVELTATALAEGVPHPRLAEALDGLCDALAAGLSGSALAMAVARYERLLLADTGFGLDLDSCALGGAAGDLAFVSPKSGRAVSRAKAAGQPWAGALLPLPRPLIDGGPATPDEAAAALRLTGHFVRRQWLEGNPALEDVRRRMAGTSQERLAGSATGDRAER